MKASCIVVPLLMGVAAGAGCVPTVSPEKVAELKALEAEGVHHIDIRPFFSSSDPSRLEFSQSYLIRSVGEKIIPNFR